MSTTLVRSSPALGRWPRRLAVIAVAEGVSVFAFWAIIIRSDPLPWGTAEYPAFAFWSLPLGVVVLLIARLTRRALSLANLYVRLFASLVLAVIAAIAWTFLAYAMTGGYALAFSVNPLICWGVGSLFAMLLALHRPSPSAGSGR